MPSWTEEGELGRSTQKWTGRRKGLIESLPNGMSTDGSVGWLRLYGMAPSQYKSASALAVPTNPHSLAAARYDDSVAANVEARWTRAAPDTNLITGTTLRLSRSATLLPSLSATSRVAPPPRRRDPIFEGDDPVRARGVRRQPSEGKERNPIGGIDTWAPAPIAATVAATGMREGSVASRARLPAPSAEQARDAAPAGVRVPRGDVRGLAQQRQSHSASAASFFHGAVVRPMPPPKPPPPPPRPEAPTAESLGRLALAAESGSLAGGSTVGRSSAKADASMRRKLRKVEYELWRETERRQLAERALHVARERAPYR